MHCPRRQALPVRDAGLEAYCSTARISTDLGITREEFFAGLEAGNRDLAAPLEGVPGLPGHRHPQHPHGSDCNIVLGGVLAQFMEPYLGELRARLCAINPFKSTGNYLKLSHYRSWSTCVGVALHFISEFIDNV